MRVKTTAFDGEKVQITSLSLAWMEENPYPEKTGESVHEIYSPLVERIQASLVKKRPATTIEEIKERLSYGEINSLYKEIMALSGAEVGEENPGDQLPASPSEN